MAHDYQGFDEPIEAILLKDHYGWPRGQKVTLLGFNNEWGYLGHFSLEPINNASATDIWSERGYDYTKYERYLLWIKLMYLEIIQPPVVPDSWYEEILE